MAGNRNCDDLFYGGRNCGQEEEGCQEVSQEEGSEEEEEVAARSDLIAAPSFRHDEKEP